MNDDALILPFDRIRAADLPRVGGKGANLGEMTGAGFPVPGGFCLTTRAFRAFLAACPESEALYELLDQVGPDDVAAARDAGRRVRAALDGVAVPAEIAAAIGRAQAELGLEEAYAVRSSATAEDLPGASFAGQQDSFLNVRGEAELVDAARRCWISLFTDRAILYRARNGFGHRGVRLSVVVQRMILSETSGILFTADPLTGHRHTLTIDASYGLGEALVGGLVSPDAYRVDKPTREIVERRIADKRAAVLPDEAGGTRQAALDEARRTATVLDDAQILSLADLGMRVEAHYGSPQDLEWGIAEGRLWLLQTRPITSLYPIDGLASPDGTLRVYFNVGHQQMMTDAMSPMGMSCVRSLLPLGRGPGEMESPYLRPSGGRLFGDLTRPLRHGPSRRLVLRVIGQFNALAPESLRLAMARPEFQARDRLSLSPGFLGGVARTAFQVLAALAWQETEGAAARVDALVAARTREARERLDRAEAGEETLRAMVDELGGLYRVVLTWAPRFAAGAVAQQILGRLGRGWADPADLDDATLGLSGNAVTEMNLALGDLADLARSAPELADLLRRPGEDGWALLARAEAVEGAGPFLAAFRDFLDRYGSRGSGEIDIRRPRWYEEPLPLLRTISGYLEGPPGAQRTQQAAMAERRREAVARLDEGARRGLFGPLRARLLRRMIAVAQEGVVLREHHKYLAVQVLRVVKERLQAMAPELVERGALGTPDDVFFLRLPELAALLRGEAQVGPGDLETRRAALDRFQALSAPLVITSDGESPAVRHEIADAPPGALLGSPVSGGVVEGRVRVLRDPSRESLETGEILVASFTDPAWTPLFAQAGGLVMETGGLMTHGSVVAREYGIPAVVSVRDATSRLRTGQRVRLDGDRGIVEPL